MDLAERRIALAQKLVGFIPAPVDPIRSIDPQIASALLQKALRRADAPFAVGAAEALLRLDPSRLWRRLVVIAYEDFGLADIQLVGDLTAAASDRVWRKTFGGDRIILRYLIDRLLQTPRDRLADDAYMLAVQMAAGNRTAAHLGMSDELAGAMAEAVQIVQSCEQIVTVRQFRAIMPRACEAALTAAVQSGEIDQDLCNVLRQAYRTSRCLLPVLISVVRQLVRHTGTTVRVRTVPPVELIGEIPSYALDGYTWIGRLALSRLIRRLPGLARLLQGIQTPALQMKALVNVLFAVEGGICTQEIQSCFRRELRGHAFGCWSGLTEPVLWEACSMMRDAIPLLDKVRAELVAEIQKPRQLELWNAK